MFCTMQTCIKDSRGRTGPLRRRFAFGAVVPREETRNEETMRHFFVLKKKHLLKSSCSGLCAFFFRASFCVIGVSKNVSVNTHLHLFEHEWKAPCACVCTHMCVCVCVCVRRHCARITLERIRRPHFQFRSISARISVIPLKSHSSPTVTSHNGANTRVVGTQLRLPDSIRCTFPIPQPVCMQTETNPPSLPPPSSEENTDLAAFHWALCRHI